MPIVVVVSFQTNLQNVYILYIVGPNIIAVNARMWTLLIKWKEKDINVLFQEHPGF
jgi:hypothetical protein